jgi:hypothetical protein
VANVVFTGAPMERFDLKRREMEEKSKARAKI